MMKDKATSLNTQKV